MVRMLEHQLGEIQLKLSEADEQEGAFAGVLASKGICEIPFDNDEPFHEKPLVEAGLYQGGGKVTRAQVHDGQDLSDDEHSDVGSSISAAATRERDFTDQGPSKPMVARILDPHMKNPVAGTKSLENMEDLDVSRAKEKEA